MVRRSDFEKRVEWDERLGRFSRCGLTVARFCRGERVSVASFYYWRKKLQQAARRGRMPARPGVFRQVTVVPAPPAMVSARPAVVSAASAGDPGAPTVSIQLPCGTRIELDVDHLDAVRAVIAEVARVDRGSGAKPSPFSQAQYPNEGVGIPSC
jgi:hypothetical protein